MRAQAFFHVTPEDTDQEKMKLLRMANKLQDQHKEQKDSYMSEEINRRQTTGVSYKGNYSSAHQYHSQDLHEGRFSHSLDHSRGSGRCNHGNMLHQCHKYSWIPFKLMQQVVHIVLNVDHSCYPCSNISAYPSLVTTCSFPT